MPKVRFLTLHLLSYLSTVNYSVTGYPIEGNSLYKIAPLLPTFIAFVRFALVWVCLFPLPLRVWDGMGLVIVARSWTFLLPFFNIKQYQDSLINTPVRNLFFQYMATPYRFYASFAAVYH